MKAEQFTNALLVLLDETFENVHGFYLDKQTSFFDTLADINAEQASVPVGGKCATLAAQVKHVAFYMDVLERSIQDPNTPDADWGEVWRTVSRVSPDEWQAICAELRDNYQRILGLIESTPEWDEEKAGGAIALIAHCAYHLGEIRQALCTLRS